MAELVRFKEMLMADDPHSLLEELDPCHPSKPFHYLPNGPNDADHQKNVFFGEGQKKDILISKSV